MREASDELGRLLDELIAWDLEEHPVMATAMGFPRHDDRLGGFSADDFSSRRRREEEFLGRFEAVDRSALGFEDEIDLDLALSELRGRAILHGREEWRRSPDGYVSACLYGVFLLFLHRLRPDAELVPDAERRLAEVPDVLDRARENLDAGFANPLLVRRSQGMAQAGVLYCRDYLPAEAGDPAMTERLSTAGDAAATALEEFTGFLGELAERSVGSFALGEEAYSELLRRREGLRDDLGSLRERGRAAYDELAADMARRARDLASTDDFRTVIREANEDHPATPDQMRAEYEEWTRRARDFLAEHDLVTFPEGEECRVVPSPPFQRPILAVASYMRPPAFTDSRVGHFFVPYPPEGTSEKDVARRLSMNSRALIPSITVHEAYPGHHWHLAVAAGNERAVRKMYGTSYFAEGWGLYVEQMMREQGFFDDPRVELLQLDMRLFRAARIVVDTSLHAGDMAVDEATEFMQDKAGLSEPVAQAEVARYCAWPTQAASYLTGSLEIERIRSDYLAADRGDLKSFHDTIAASGVLPLALAERVMMSG